MDNGTGMLWIALGISVVVGFVFFILAEHWHRLLKIHSWSLRRLTERIQALETMEDPSLRKKAEESAPVPLEQVYTFGFRLSDGFWRAALDVPAEELNSIRACGKFLGSVKIERWRSHSVASVTELLPQSQSARWQTRSLDIFPDGVACRESTVVLWDLPLASQPRNPSGGIPPKLELRLAGNRLELCAVGVGCGSENGSGNPVAEKMFFAIPLDVSQLAEFRKPFEAATAQADATPPSELWAAPGVSWLAYYGNADEDRGIDWHLVVRDLRKKSEWEYWKVLDSRPVQRFGGTE